MSDTYFETKVDEWLPAVEDTRNEEERRRILTLFAKDIERDVRHKAASMAMSLSNDIHNMRHST